MQIATRRGDVVLHAPGESRPAARALHLPAPRTPSRSLPRRICGVLYRDAELLFCFLTSWGREQRRYNGVDPCLALLKADSPEYRPGEAQCFSARICNPRRLRTTATLTLTIATPDTAAEAILQCSLRLDGRTTHDVQFIMHGDAVAVTVDGQPCETLTLERRSLAEAADKDLCATLSLHLPERPRAVHRLQVFRQRNAGD